MQAGQNWRLALWIGALGVAVAGAYQFNAISVQPISRSTRDPDPAVQGTPASASTSADAMLERDPREEMVGQASPHRIQDLMNEAGNPWARRLVQVSKYRAPFKHPGAYYEAMQGVYGKQRTRAERIDKLLALLTQERFATARDELLLHVAEEYAGQHLWDHFQQTINRLQGMSEATTFCLEIARIESAHASMNSFSEEDLDHYEYQLQYLASVFDHKSENPDRASEVALYRAATLCNSYGQTELASRYLELLVARQGHYPQYFKTDVEFLERRLADSPDYALRADDYYIRPEDLGALELIRRLITGTEPDRLLAEEKASLLVRKYSSLRYPDFWLSVLRAQNLLALGQSERARQVASHCLQGFERFLEQTKYPRTDRALVRDLEEIIAKTSK